MHKLAGFGCVTTTVTTGLAYDLAHSYVTTGYGLHPAAAALAALASIAASYLSLRML